MPLFDETVETIGTRAKNYAEPLFDYYNRSARPPLVLIRAVNEQWFDRFPESAKADLRGRFRSPRDRQHHGAFFELYIHELLVRLGYSVEAHPEVDEPTHPDFLVSHNGRPLFYVEATISTESDEEAGQQRLMDQVYDSLNRLRSPDFFLALRVRGAPENAPPGARLRRDLERWLATLDWAAIRQRWDKGGFEALPAFPWEHEGWSVLIHPLPKSEQSRGNEEIRPIALNMPLTVTAITADEGIRDAVRAKNKYGQLDLPYLVAINVLDQFCSRYDVMNALFGHETVVFGPNGTRPGGRLHDGAWDAPQGPRNQTISAVMVYRQLTTWNMKENDPWLVHNPWANNPLASNLLPFQQYIPNKGTGMLEPINGERPGDFLGLAEPWPLNE